MSKVNFFKTKETISPDERPKEFGYYLDRICKGSSQKIITNLRTEIDPEKKKVLKNSLPGITFCGTFTSRKKENLKQGSGLAILDFDKLNDAYQFKNDLKSNDFIMAAWISPSGNGVKALVKIPIIKNDSEYKHIFKQLKELFPYFNLNMFTNIPLNRSFFKFQLVFHFSSLSSFLIFDMNLHCLEFF